MKKTYLLIVSLVTGIVLMAQPVPNNLNIGIFNNGSNGSNAGSGGYLELALRPVIQVYGAPPTNPVAEDFGVILVAPKTDFDMTDNIVISQVNASLFGSTATAAMSPQGIFDIGDANLYYPISLNNAGGVNLSSLALNNWGFAFTVSFSNAKTPAQFRTVRIVDQTSHPQLSTFFGAPIFSSLTMQGGNQLTASAFTVLPVSLINFSGYKSGTKNVLKWTTANEQNNVGFEVQRSSDGVSYSAIGFVNTLAPGGNSSSDLSYTFDDNSPAASRKSYYRLNQKDFDGRSKLSNIVVINGGKPTILGIGGLFPNPASTLVNVIIDAPKRDDVTLVVMDVTGKTVKQKLVNVETGSNTVPVEIGNLAQGSYMVKLVCKSSDCETAVSKFVKQ